MRRAGDGPRRTAKKPWRDSGAHWFFGQGMAAMFVMDMGW